MGLLQRGQVYQHAKARVLRELSRSGLLGRLGRTRSATIKVLVYHDVLPAPIDRAAPTLGLTTSIDEFEWQMQYLRDRYRPLSLAESIACLRGKSSGGNRPPVLVTFDDGHSNNLHHALPVLEHFGIPAVCFVVADYVGAPSSALWIEQLYLGIMATCDEVLSLPSGRVLKLTDGATRALACGEVFGELRRLPRERFAPAVAELQSQLSHILELQPADRYEFLDVPDLRRLMSAGVSVGSHSRTHALLSRLPDDEARDEIAGSKQRLERLIGTTVTSFAFPFGERGFDFDDREMRYVSEAGYELAFAGSGGPVRQSVPRFAIPRIGFDGGISRPYFEYCLSGLREPVQALLSKL